MILNLIDLNQSVPSHIFKRGKSYFQNGQVQHIKQSKSNTSTFHAEVLGTELYLVQLEVNDQLDILSSNCDCPYTITDFCKHQVALCYGTPWSRKDNTSQLLHYCQVNLYNLPEHVQWLKAEYPQETKELYLQWLYEKASSASNRSNYRQVCREIKAFKKLFGDEATALLVDALQKKYPLRTAFLDELDKMKTKKGL